MTAINRSAISIYIVPAGTNASALASTDKVLGEIKSYSKSGGEVDVESDPVFGGYVDKEKPRSQVEIQLEIVPSLDNADRWDSLIYGETSGVYTMNTVGSDKAVFIEAVSGSLKKSWGFNNCNSVNWEISHNADDNQTGTFTFKFSPTTSSGVSNFMTKGTSVTVLPAWSTLTTA